MIKSMPLTFDSSRVNKNLFTAQDYSAMDKNVSSQNLMVSDRFAEFFIKGVRSFRKLQKQFSRFQNISEYFKSVSDRFQASFRKFQKVSETAQTVSENVSDSFGKFPQALSRQSLVCSKTRPDSDSTDNTMESGIVENQFRRHGDLRGSMQIITFTASPGDKAPQQTEAYAHNCLCHLTQCVP